MARDRQITDRAVPRTTESIRMALILENDEVFEVPDADVEEDPSGLGFWYLAAEGEDEEEFYSYEEVEYELDEAAE